MEDDTKFKKMLDERQKTADEMKETLWVTNTYPDGEQVKTPNWGMVRFYLDFEHVTMQKIKAHQEKKQKERVLLLTQEKNS